MFKEQLKFLKKDKRINMFCIINGFGPNDRNNTRRNYTEDKEGPYKKQIVEWVCVCGSKCPGPENIQAQTVWIWSDCEKDSYIKWEGELCDTGNLSDSIKL
jgi:hypothetical protein